MTLDMDKIREETAKQLHQQISKLADKVKVAQINNNDDFMFAGIGTDCDQLANQIIAQRL